MFQHRFRVRLIPKGKEKETERNRKIRRRKEDREIERREGERDLREIHTERTGNGQKTPNKTGRDDVRYPAHLAIA